MISLFIYFFFIYTCEIQRKEFYFLYNFNTEANKYTDRRNICFLFQFIYLGARFGGKNFIFLKIILTRERRNTEIGIQKCGQIPNVLFFISSSLFKSLNYILE